jgi:2-phosphoglycerate kinase
MTQIYIIGGIPRCGKSTIAKRLSDKLALSLIEGDAIRRGLRSSLFGMPEVFAPEITFNGEVNYHSIGVKERTKRQFEFKGHENQLTLLALEGVINHYEANNQDVIIEGPMIEPAWVQELVAKGHAVKSLFVGYLADSHFDTIQRHANGNEHDWVNGLNDEQQNRYRDIWLQKSQQLASESEENEQSFIDISTYEDFDMYISDAIARVQG